MPTDHYAAPARTRRPPADAVDPAFAAAAAAVGSGAILLGGRTGSGKSATAAGLAAVLLRHPQHSRVAYVDRFREYDVPTDVGEGVLVLTAEDAESPEGWSAWADVIRRGVSSTVVADDDRAGAAGHVAAAAEAGCCVALVRHGSDLASTMRGYVEAAVRHGGLTPGRAAASVELAHHQLLLRRADGGQVPVGEWVPITPEIRWCLTYGVEEWQDGRRVDHGVPPEVRADVGTIMLRRAIVRAWRAGRGRSRERHLRVLVREGAVRADDAARLLTRRQSARAATGTPDAPRAP